MERRGVSPVVAEVIMVAVAIVIAVAVASWLLGVWRTSTVPEYYYPLTLTLNAPGESRYQPIPGVAGVTVWSEASGDETTVYVRVTASVNLAYVHVKATITNRTGDPPVYVGAQYSTVEWEEGPVPAGWYSERYWTPVQASEYPVTVQVHLWVKPQG